MIKNHNSIVFFFFFLLSAQLGLAWAYWSHVFLHGIELTRNYMACRGLKEMAMNKCYIFTRNSWIVITSRHYEICLNNFQNSNKFQDSKIIFWWFFFYIKKLTLKLGFRPNHSRIQRYNTNVNVRAHVPNY